MPFPYLQIPCTTIEVKLKIIIIKSKLAFNSREYKKVKGHLQYSKKSIWERLLIFLLENYDTHYLGWQYGRNCTP